MIKIIIRHIFYFLKKIMCLLRRHTTITLRQPDVQPGNSSYKMFKLDKFVASLSKYESETRFFVFTLKLERFGCDYVRKK